MGDGLLRFTNGRLMGNELGNVLSNTTDKTDETQFCQFCQFLFGTYLKKIHYVCSLGLIFLCSES